MKSHRVLLLFFIPCCYLFLSDYFPAVPTFVFIDFMDIIKAEPADHPRWVGG
jgi:hypothetical protein